MPRPSRSALLLLAASFLVPVVLTGCSQKKATPGTASAPVVALPAAPKQHVPMVRTTEARDGSAIVVAKVGERTVAYIADEDDSAVRAVDVRTSEQLSRTALDGRPGQMIVDASGRLLVALRTEQTIAVLEANPDVHEALDSTARIDTAGAEPIALALTPDDATLVVTTGWGHSLEGYTLKTTQRRFNVDLAREPRAVTVSSDGKTAYVAHAAASHISAIDLPTGSEAENTQREVKKIDLGMSGWTESRFGSRRNTAMFGPMLNFKLDSVDLGFDGEREFPIMRCGMGRMHREITFPSRVSRQGFALAKIQVRVKDPKAKQGSELFEERILAPHMEVATGDATVRSSGYGGGGLEEAESIPSEMFDIDVVDAGKRTRTTGLSSRVAFNFRTGPEACRLPRAAVVDTAHQRLLVSCLGIDKIMEYDASGTTPTGGFRRSIDVASGPTGIAIDPGSEKALVWSAFDRVLNVFSIAEPPESGTDKANPTKAKATVQSPEVVKIVLPAPSSPLSAEAALGEKLFHKAGSTKISKDGRACASCHPDGRDDALVWSTPDGPRQTILLAGRVDRETPFGWLGKHGSLKEHIAVTMKNLKGTGASDEELGALVAWLRAMKAPPRAKTVGGTKEERGRELFNSSALQCGSCHAEKTGFSDHESHDVASATGADVSRQFLVPSLRFVGGSGPYFHDGRYASLGELLQKNDKMGDTKSLPQEDRDALEAYLRTL